jgi:hypothetical protein
MLWIARLVTLTLVAAMADAAVGSVHGPMPSLAAIGAAALLGAGAFALFWSRPWIGTAVATLVLFAAFAFATTAGVGASPAATGLGSADTAAVVFGVAILAAAVALWFAIPHLIARVLAVLLALYGLVTTAASIQHGGLVAAFGSAPLAWTRGSYVAAEVLLPLAALAALVHALVLFARKRGAAGAASFVLAVALVAATQLGAFAAGVAGLATIVAFEHPNALAAQQAVANTGVSGTTSGVASPSAAANALSANGSALGANGATGTIGANGATSTSGGLAQGSGVAGSGALFVPKGSGDVSPEVAAAFPGVPKDPQHALASVAALGNDLYPGALGGAVGALRSGSGNSIDKTLLLRDLLRSGTPSIATQFAQCTLADADADAFVAQIRATKVHPKILLQAASGVLASTSDPKAEAVLQTWAGTWKSMVTKTQTEGTKLSSALATAGVTLPQNVPGAARLRALAANHVWLRANVAGAWVDLDPTIEGAVPGKTRCSPQTVAAALPDDDYDVLGVRVTSESSQPTPQLAAVLDQTIRTADLSDRDVTFMFAEPTGMDAGLTPAVAPTGATAFTPLLRIGDESVTGTPIVLPQQSFGPGPGAAISRGFKGVTGLLDASATPTPIPAATAPPVAIVSALWIDLSVSAPGADPTRVRSPIFDRIGFVARAGKTTTPPLTEQPEAEDYRAMQTVWNVAVSGGNVTSGAGPSTIGPALDAGALSGALARMNGAYFNLRRALMDDASGGVVDVAAAQPGISLVAVSNNGGMMIDLASDDAVPLTANEARPLYSSASVLAEREIINKNSPVDSGSGASTNNDALAEFDVDALTGAKLLGLHPGDASLDANAAVPAEARARISAHLASGASVLAMAPPALQAGGPPYAFWVADPATGTLRDENERGRHTELGEEVETEQPAVKAVPKWKQMACNLVTALMLAVTQDSGAVEGKSVANAAANAAAKSEEQTSCGP